MFGTQAIGEAFVGRIAGSPQEVTAKSDDGCIMGVKHLKRPVYGIQFHPESVLTPDDMNMIENFLNI